MFHRHKHEHFFTCTLDDIGCPEFRVKTEHGPKSSSFYYTRDGYGDKIRPYPKHVQVVVKRCSCGDITLRCSDGSTDFLIDHDYAVAKVLQLKKIADQKEEERLLNICNPDYLKVKMLEEELKNKDKIINEKLNKIDALEEKIKAIIQDNQAKSKILTEVQEHIQAVKKIKIKDEKVKEILKDIFYEIDMLKATKNESPIIKPSYEMIDKILA
jgi:hypothetical protein